MLTVPAEYEIELETEPKVYTDVGRKYEEEMTVAEIVSRSSNIGTILIQDMIGNEVLRDSETFAELAQAELGGIARAPSRGVKQAPFVVLDVVRMPAALIEIGFLSNREEERALKKDRSRDEIAAALERAVATYRVQYDARRGVGQGR